VSYEEAPQTTDPNGRVVVFDTGTREHLRNRRPELLDHIGAILDVVNLPDYREEDDKRPGHERFYRQDLDPRRWLTVVVSFNEAPAYVVTAWVQAFDPRPQR
jgi:hypothetical protein